MMPKKGIFKEGIATHLYMVAQEYAKSDPHQRGMKCI